MLVLKAAGEVAAHIVMKFLNSSGGFAMPAKKKSVKKTAPRKKAARAAVAAKLKVAAGKKTIRKRSMNNHIQPAQPEITQAEHLGGNSSADATRVANSIGERHKQ